MSDANDNARSVRIAVEYRDVDAVRRAIAAGKDIEERDEVGATPLMIACGSNQFAIAELLIVAGADVTAADRFGLTAERMASVIRFTPGTAEHASRERVLAALRRRPFA